jgi:hypothetical protein
MVGRNGLLLALLCAAIYVIGFAGNANAGPNTDPRCDGLSGAAYGMCTAAIAVGCDDKTATNPGCDTIEEKFTQVTGETPPWTLPPCPCGTSERMITHLESEDGPIGCSDEAGRILGIETKAYVNAVFSIYPYQDGSKQTCGYNNTSAYSMSDDEANSCLIEVRSTIDAYGLTCVVPPTK